MAWKSNPERLEIIRAWIEAGESYQGIADRLGIHKSTVGGYAKRHKIRAKPRTLDNEEAQMYVDELGPLPR